MIRIGFWAATVVSLFLGTAPAEDFPSIRNSEEDREARPMSPAMAAASFKVPRGFRVGVYASEPDVQNPIDMAWDDRGRLWIAENYTYAERSQRFDLTMRDRVIILEDVNDDGLADKRTVFTDQVQMLTSIEVAHDGVWLMCPPRLLFVPDADRDDVPDGPASVVLDGFEVAKENYHNLANGLRWGPDRWLYGRCGGSCPGRLGLPGTPDERRVALEGGIWRFHPRTKHVEVLTHGTTNPWGHDWNQFGEGFFINTVNGHLWHLIPGAHLDRPFTLDPNPHVYELLDMHADHWHFDTGTSWQESRDGVANSYGGGHAHCGMMIYLGDNWPDVYRGRLLTFNIHGRRVNQELLRRDGSGYVAHHGRDMLLSADPFFRGMELSYGPDGAVYVLDWSDTGECHEKTGVHRTSGRVFRITYGDHSERRREIDLHSLSNGQLVAQLTHRNHWHARHARSILTQRFQGNDQGVGDVPSTIQSLRELVDDADPSIAYRALVTLYALQATDAEYLRGLLTHRNEHLRAWAIRLLTDHWPIDDVFGPLYVSKQRSDRISQECTALLADFCQVASGDESGLVRLALASTLQRMPVKSRAPLAARLVERQQDANDHNLPLLVWYGLIPIAEVQPMELADLATRSRWPKTQRLAARRLAEQIDEHPAAVDKLLATVAETSDVAVRRNLLAGIADGLKGWSRAPQPKKWHDVVAAVQRDGHNPTKATIRELSILFGDGRALDEVRRIVLDKESEIGIRRSALETLVAAGGDEIVGICLPLLKDARLNVVAARGVSKSGAREVALALIENYSRFRAPHRPKVIEILVSRPAFAAELLDAIEDETIAASDLTAFDVRQIRSIRNPKLNARISKLWGEIREAPQEKRERIASLKGLLNQPNLATADPARGRVLFDQSCAKCHRLFGQGESTGPDLTGANRNNIDYLLDNIVDPSAVVSKDFRMTIVETTDGRVLNGLVVSKNNKTLTLQTQTDLQTISLEKVRETNKTTLSPMPDGLLDNLSEKQIRDLIAYLMQPSQIRIPKPPESR